LNLPGIVFHLLARYYYITLLYPSKVFWDRFIVIDPITVIWSALQDGRLEFKTKNIDKAASGEEKAFFSYQDWGQIKRFYSMLMTKLVNLSMHVVMIGRQKDE
jgi:hypothetical protein